MWVVAAVAGVAVVATGWLPWSDAADVLTRVAPILGFLVGITVVAELADAAAVFDVAASRAAQLARGRTLRLFALVAVLGTVITVVLSLDTTAVLLTPVVLSMAQQLELDPVPFALATVWLANTASLLLPVSNLTNLLAVDRLHLSAAAFAARMWLPEVAAVGVTVLLLGGLHRRRLRRRFVPPRPATADDPVLFGLGVAVCVAIVPAFVAGVPVEWPAAGAAAVLVAGFAARRRSALRWALVPWRLVVLVIGLFLLVTAAGEHGLDAALAHAAGTSGSALGVLRTAAVGAAAGNAVNNLPAYLAVERVASGHTDQLLGLLLGTNLGPLVTLWASLATLLWRERCRARGVTVSARRFVSTGLLGVPLLLGLSWLALLVTS